MQHVLEIFGGRGKIWIILDNARVHHAKDLKPFLDEVRGELELIYLPAYSPDLNVIERIWRFLRKEVTHDEYYPTFDLFTDALSAFFYKYSNPSEVIKMLCAVS